ncbi:DcrB family lipoprotein [Pantoea sp. 1.19]|uniref:DcrB family lipoprotein n=1 Tax=Pantoea sp. 1.19 TaxID=1925589 RepID=UPI000948B394|nr:DcrB family lipoprotein [Pantoea sp. 1.19]
MQKLLKYAAVALFVSTLAACDGKEDSAPAADSAGASSQAAQSVSLLDGKFTFALPPGMSDQSGKLGTQSNNMHVYADGTGQRAIIVIAGDATSESLDTLTGRLEQQQRNRDANLQVVSNKAIEIGGQPMQQLDTVMSANGQSAWSTVVLGKVDGKLVTLQITLPADNQQQAQTDAESVVSSIRVK